MFPRGGFGGGRNGQRKLVCPPLPIPISAQISSIFQTHLHEILDSAILPSCTLSILSKSFSLLQYSPHPLHVTPCYPSAIPCYLLLQELSLTPKVFMAASFGLP